MIVVVVVHADDLDPFSYQLTNEQAQGIIAKRDFVNLTTRRYIDDTALLAAEACLYPGMPSKEK